MLRKKAIKEYCGQLTPELVAVGMNAAAKNSERLLEDAKILFAAQRYPTACSLAILSIEEAGKLSQLKGIATAPTEKHLKEAWRGFRDHQTKNAPWIILDLVAKGARTLNDLRPIFDEESNHTAVLETGKQLGFYADCYGKGHWSEPHSAIDEKLARSIMQIAEILKPKHVTTTREIELWIEHVAPVWGLPTMLDGMREYDRAMENEGLARHTSEEIEAFCHGII